MIPITKLVSQINRPAKKKQFFFVVVHTEPFPQKVETTSISLNNFFNTKILLFSLTPKTVKRRFYNQGSYLMIMLLILLNSDVDQ